MQTKDFKGLLILFSGHTFKEGEIILNNGTDEISTSIQKLCKQFDASCCPNLKNNPKIFIFEVSMAINIKALRLVLFHLYKR